MTIKKILSVLLALVIVLSFGACKSRNNEQSEKPKGARENVEVSENPRTEENLLKPVSPSSSEAEPSEPEKDTVPEEMTDSFLGAIKSGVRENIQAFTDYNILFNLTEGQGADWLLRQVLLRLNYEIISSNVEEDKAAVTVKISNLDMSLVLPLYFEQAMAISFENASERLGKTQEELDAEYRKIFVDLLTQYENTRIDRLTDIELEKVAGEWKIKTAPELGNAVLGGFLEAQDRVRGDMQQSKAENPPGASSAPQEDSDDEYADIGFDGDD